MKTLIVIFALNALVLSSGVAFVNHEIDLRVQQAHAVQQTEFAEDDLTPAQYLQTTQSPAVTRHGGFLQNTYNPQATVTAQQLNTTNLRIVE